MVDPESNLDRMSIRANYWMTLSPSPVDDNAGDGDGNGAAVEEVVEKLQDISNPESVRKIGFVGQLGQLSGYKPLECILNPCKNITSLYLHLSIFSATTETLKMEKKPEPWQVSCIIPRLKELVIDSCGISCEDSTDLLEYRPTLLSTAAFLCSQKFIALEKLIFRVPYMESVEGIIVRSVCIFMGRHAATLKSFAFTQKYELDGSQNDENRDESCENNGESQNEKGEHRGEGDSFVEKGRDGYFSTNVNYLNLTQLGLSAQELKNVILEEFHVKLACKQESAPVWKNMLIKQNHLKKCIFAGDKLPIPSGTIEGNCKTLVTVRLDVRDGVNLECFRNCVNLKHLSLGGRNEVDESFNDGEGNSSYSGSEKYYPLTAYLKNAKFLPVGLESLEIINLKTHKEDASIIALHLRNLRDLILKNIGWEGNLGLRLCDLTKVWRLGRLDHLCIKQSLNLISYSELEENSLSPELNLFACVIQSNSFTTASKFFLEVWRKDDSGLYTTRKPDSIEQSDEEELDVFQMPNKVELSEEEEEEEESSSDSEEEGEEDDDGDAGEGGNKKGDSDEEWQECEDEEEDDD